MYPMQRSPRLLPHQIFYTDEDIDNHLDEVITTDFDVVYIAARRVFMTYHAMCSKDIQSLFHVDKKMSDKVMNVIKKEYLDNI